MIFEEPFVRFGVSGTLIGLYGLVEHAARRRAPDPLRAPVGTPRALVVIVFVCILAFYATIRPFGGAIAGGAGNVAGIGMAFLAMALRFHLAGSPGRLRMPDVAARLLFYAVLPLAVGAPFGWLVLTVPAVITSVWACLREDRLQLERHGDAWRQRMRDTSRLLPGLW